MFEYEFYDPAGDAEPVPPASPTKPEGFVSLADVVSLRPTYWGEHCVECAMPLCFGTCVHYEARPDGKCKRFAYGIKDSDDPAFAGFPYHAEMSFRPWGKLETLVYPGTAPVEAVLEQNERYRRDAVAVALRRAERPDSVVGDDYASLFKRGYFGAVDAVSDADLGKDTEFFVFQAYSHESEPFELSFEVTSLQRLVHRCSLRMEPGYNQHVVPLRISTQPVRDLADSKDELLARIIPQGDFAARIVVLMAEFANLTPEAAARFAGAPEGDAKGAARSGRARQEVPAKPADKVKCVCWDLDNTVWAGTLIESDPGALELRPGVLETMRELDRRGIVQMVVSKNQEDEALPVLERLGIRELFVYALVNWNAKSDNILRIADMLNINVDTFAFVDDQPFERAEVGESLPCVRVYAETDVPALLDAPAFDVPVTADGSKRRIMYQTEAKRRALEEGFSGSNIDFLRSCGLTVRISLPDTEAKRLRSYELVQRTNQLNLSGRRYEPDEFMALVTGEQGARTACVMCEDRFGSYGQAGYAVLEQRGRVLYVREFAMSCRVMGKCVENALAAWLVGLARARGADQVVLKGRRTSRNALVVRTFERVGFEDAALFDEDIVLAMAVDAPIAHDDVVNVVDEASDLLVLERSSRELPGGDPSEVLAFVPHQDDEVLTLGAGLADAARRTGGRVAVVLCTDGKNCETRLRLNDGASCPELGDDHRFALDAATYGRLRDVEFADSCKALGVQERAVLLPDDRMEDGCLTVEGSRRIIERYVRLYPDATVFTHALIEPEDDAVVPDGAVADDGPFPEEHVWPRPDGGLRWASQHRDHRLLSQAALELFGEGAIARLELFVEYYHLGQFKSLNPAVPLVERVAVGESADRLRAAVEAYFAWDPEHRRYALGWHGAQRELTYLKDRLSGYSYFPARGDGEEARAESASETAAARAAALEGVADELGRLRAELRALGGELERERAASGALRSSTTYRAGRALMALPCALRDLIRRS